jgi:5-aminopentanamidase
VQVMGNADTSTGGRSAAPPGGARRYRAAVCQFEPLLLDKEANLIRMEGLVQRAAAEGARLAVFAECCLTGYGVGRDGYGMIELAEPVEGPERGPSVRRMERLAVDTGVQVVFGMPELAAGGQVYNSAVIVDPGGALTVAHRKAHLWRAEGKIFTPGGSFRPRTAPEGLLGPLVCYDLDYPEASRVLVIKGAEVLTVCNAFPRPWVDYQRTYALARAMENSVYVVLANYQGRVRTFDFFGGSMIVSPYGRVLAEAGTGEAVLVAELDLEVVARAREELGYLAGRRPELYAE